MRAADISDDVADISYNCFKIKGRIMGSRCTSGGTKHLRFEKQPLEKGRKIHKYEIWNDEFNQYLGEVHWRGGWRKYVWQLIAGVDVSPSCGRELIKFTEGLTTKWREELKRKKGKGPGKGGSK